MAGSGLGSALIFAPIAYVIWAVILVLITIGAKHALIGRYSQGIHPVWGLYFIRWWVVHRLASSCQIVLRHIASTPMLRWYLKAMGASVGERVQINTVYIADFDLVSFGDGCIIGEVSTLQVANLTLSGIFWAVCRF